MFRLLLVVTLLVLAGATAVEVFQEKPARPTRTWRAFELPPIEWRMNRVYVDVIDTEGVCLYVTRSDNAANQVALAAVPKSQLPPGTGCQ